MKLFDYNGKLFGKISIVDLIIIVFIVAAAGGSYVFLKKNIDESKATRSYSIILEYRGIEENLMNAIIPGKTVYERVQNQPIGTLQDVKFEPDTEYNISSLTGELVYERIPGKYDAHLYLDITTDEDIYVGKYLSIGTKDFTGAGYIISVEKK